MTTLDHLHYGSDFPFTPEPVVAAAAERIDGVDALVDALRSNTARLFTCTRLTSREDDTMEHQIELGYLVLEVPDPDALASVFADVVGLVPGERTAAGTGTGATTNAPTACSFRPDRQTTRSRSVSRRWTPPHSTPSSPGCRGSVPTSPTATATTDGCNGLFGRPHHGASTSRSSCSWTTRRPVHLAAGPGRIPHRGGRIRPCRVRHHRLRPITPVPDRRAGLRPVRLAGNGHRARVSNWKCASTTATAVTTRSPSPGHRSSFPRSCIT